MQGENFILRRATDRYLWEKRSKENQKKKDKVDEQERAQMAQIDWYDFVVVDIIEFTEEELYNTVAITSSNQNANLNVSSFSGNVNLLLNGTTVSLTNQNTIVSAVYDKLNAQGSKKDDIQIVDENDIINNSKRLLGLAAFEKENRDKVISANEMNEETKLNVGETVLNTNKDNVVSKKEIVKEVPVKEPILLEPGMKIVTNYKRKAESSTAKKTDSQRCPLCNENIPVDELSHHMRIELLDPKWKEINKEIAERKMEVNIAPTSDFISYLGEFARDRPDLFGEDVGDILKIDEIKKLETKINMQNIRFDGFAPNMSRTTANIAMLAQQTKKNYEESTKAKEIHVNPNNVSSSSNTNSSNQNTNTNAEKTTPNNPTVSVNAVPISVKQQEPVLLNQMKNNANIVSSNINVIKKDIEKIPSTPTNIPSQMGKRMIENLYSEEIWINKNPVTNNK